MALSSLNIARWASNMRQSLVGSGNSAKAAALSTLDEPDHKASDTKLVTAVAHSNRGLDGAFNASSEMPGDGPEANAQSNIDAGNDTTEMTASEMMELEKQQYPGASEWAHDEERLFEILYLRQDLPMLPSHWNIDFRGFPLPENIFDTSKEHPAIIYAHNKNGATEFAGT
jgi:hypothetical protein